MRLPALLAICALALSLTPLHAEKHALLVGINDYQYARDLQGSLNDIAQIREVLVKELGFSENRIETLIDAQATKANILAALARVAERSRAGDSFFWYYSGHGFMSLDEDGDEAVDDAEDRYDEVLVPFDGRPWPRERATDPNPTMLRDDEIARSLADLTGRKVVVFFDSCHSGSGTRAVGDAESRSLYEGYLPPEAPKTRGIKRSRETLDLSGSMVFVSAASPVQTASDLGEFEGRRHGAFTASLLRSIRAAGPGWQRTVSWEGLHRQIQQDMLSHGFASQTPTFRSTNGLGKRTVDQFFNPPPAGEIADLESSRKAFAVQLESNKYQFRDGELLQLFVESERAGYLYIFDVDPAQKVTQLFPNRFTTENRIRAAEVRAIPEPGNRYQFRAGEPWGRSTITAIVTAEPWVEADRLQLPTNFQPIAENQKAGLRDQLRRLQDAAVSGNSDPGWSSQKIVLEIVPKDFQPPVEVEEVAAAEPSALPAPPALPPAPVSAPAAARGIDDANLSREDQTDLEQRRPELFAKLKQLAERFSPVFWQDVSGNFDKDFRPWKDFIVRYDFDTTDRGPNWPEPPQFQDENKRERNRYLDALLVPNADLQMDRTREREGILSIRNTKTGETSRLDLRPHVYWSALTTPTHYFLHYVVFHAEDWKGMMGHTGDLEGTTVVVDRQSERMVAAFTLAHDDVEVVRSLDEDPEPNIQVLVDPSLEARGLIDEDDGRAIEGSLTMEAGRDGEPAAKEHQDIYIETKGHGEYGPKKIKPSRYIVYANYLDNSTFTVPSFDKAQYPLTDKFDQVSSKHRYELVYIGSSTTKEQTLWGEYRGLGRFGGGVNPPWNWRDNLFFKTGWWRDPLRVKKIGDPRYLINPYLETKR